MFAWVVGSFQKVGLMAVSKLCHRDALAVRRTDEVIKAAQLMRERHVGYLVVTEPNPLRPGERPVGVLTDRDIVVAVVARKLVPGRVTVGEVMTQPPVTVRDTDSVEKALREMRRVGVRRLPVVDQHGALVGIVSVDDMIGFVASELRIVVDAIGEYAERATGVGP